MLGASEQELTMNGDFETNLEDDFNNLVREVADEFNCKLTAARDYASRNIAANNGEYREGWNGGPSKGIFG